MCGISRYRTACRPVLRFTRRCQVRRYSRAPWPRRPAPSSPSIATTRRSATTCARGPGGEPRAYLECHSGECEQGRQAAVVLPGHCDTRSGGFRLQRPAAYARRAAGDGRQHQRLQFRHAGQHGAALVPLQRQGTAAEKHHHRRQGARHHAVGLRERTVIAARHGIALFIMLACAARASAQQTFPANRAIDVNPDTHLVLTFTQAPQLGRSGQIRIYDASDNRLVDMLDLGIPHGPTERSSAPAPPYLAIPYPYDEGLRRSNVDTKPGTPSAGAAPVPGQYQLTIIGGFTDGFHFHPVISTPR